MSYGDGSVYQRKDKLWVAKVKDKHTGKTKYFYGHSEREVKRKLSAYNKTDLHEESTVANQDIKTFFEAWLKNEALSLKPKSYATKKYVVEKIITPNLIGIKVGQLNSNDVQGLIHKLVDEEYSYSTIKKAYDAINKRYKTAITKGELVNNPCVGVVLPKKDERKISEIRYFSQDELSKIIKEATRTNQNGTLIYRIGYAFQLIASTGLRVGELLALQWNDIDFDNKRIKVNKNVVYATPSGANGVERIVQNSTKTNSGNRIIPMSNTASEALRKLQDINGYCDYIISTSAKKPMNPRQLARTFDAIQTKAKIEPKGTLHSLRHTFATRLIQLGTDVKVVSSLLGHSDINITYNVYIHVIDEQRVRAVENIDKI